MPVSILHKMKMLEIITRLKALFLGLYSEFDGCLYMVRRVNISLPNLNEKDESSGRNHTKRKESN